MDVLQCGILQFTSFSRAIGETKIIRGICFNVGFSQLARCFVTKMVDSDGLKWTQVDRAGLVFGHNLDTVWSFLWVRGLPLVLLARSS